MYIIVTFRDITEDTATQETIFDVNFNEDLTIDIDTFDKEQTLPVQFGQIFIGNDLTKVPKDLSLVRSLDIDELSENELDTISIYTDINHEEASRISIKNLITKIDSLKNYQYSPYFARSFMELPNVGNTRTLYIVGETEFKTTYMWNEDENHYYILATNYNEIETIWGGGAN